MKALRQQIFQAMSQDIGVMAEWGDDEEGLREEVFTCDEDILETYRETFLEE